MRRFVDLSHSVENGMITYPGLPGPVICDYLSREASRERYAPGVEFQIGKIEMVGNTGTYLDSPFHRFAGIEVAGRAVLVQTGWDIHWRTPAYLTGNPFLTAAAAAHLAAEGAAL